MAMDVTIPDPTTQAGYPLFIIIQVRELLWSTQKNYDASNRQGLQGHHSDNIYLSTNEQ